MLRPEQYFRPRLSLPGIILVLLVLLSACGGSRFSMRVRWSTLWKNR